MNTAPRNTPTRKPASHLCRKDLLMSLKHLFTPSPKDERITAQLASVYKTGFFVLFFGILFDVFTRYNYLAQTDANGNPFAQSTLETVFLLVACAVVVGMMGKRGVYSDSLRYTEAHTFLDTGMIAPTLATAALIGIAAVGGRLYNEVVLFGWSEVTWAGDIAMLVIIFGMFAILLLALQYLMWRSYRIREERLLSEAEDE